MKFYDLIISLINKGSIKLLKKILNKLIKLNRLAKQLIMLISDSVLVVLVLLSSFSLRLGYFYWPKEEVFWLIFITPVLALPIFLTFRLYRSVIRYIGPKALWSITQAVTLYAVLWGLLAYEFSRMTALPMTAQGIPRSVILINWMLILLAIGGSRLLAKWLFDEQRFFSHGSKSNVIIYGAGSAGRQLSHSLQLSSGYKHVAYIDDNLAKDRAYINNIPVFSYNDIEKLVEKNNITDIFLALPSVSRKNRNLIIEKLSKYPVHVRILPSVSDLAGGRIKIDDLLEIDTGDLLGRTPVKPDEKMLRTKITNKVIMVTGAGGSIGSELSRQIIKLNPKKLILFDISESSLYQIEQEIIKINNSDIELIPIIGSVCSSNQLTRIFKRHKVETIYHAAAYKHVPLVEENPAQGVLNNSIGTMTLAESAIASNVKTFVLISTDKAVRPTNVMGATKRVAELVLQSLAEQDHNTCFTMVRFGNVLGSSGSVIPLFKKQIREGGPLTVTDANVVRYFMTIPESVELVLQAGAMGKGGDVFVLDMGDPVKIYDLAVKMIRLSGLQVLDEHNQDGDIEIKFTGLRPGEKLYEELLVGDNVTITDNRMIMRAREKMVPWDILKPMLEEIKEVSNNGEQVKIRELLTQIVPEFIPNPHNKD